MHDPFGIADRRNLYDGNPARIFWIIIIILIGIATAIFIHPGLLLIYIPVALAVYGFIIEGIITNKEKHTWKGESL